MWEGRDTPNSLFQVDKSQFHFKIFHAGSIFQQSTFNDFSQKKFSISSQFSDAEHYLKKKVTESASLENGATAFSNVQSNLA